MHPAKPGVFYQNGGTFPNKHDSFDTKVSETNGGYGITLYDEVHVHE